MTCKKIRLDQIKSNQIKLIFLVVLFLIMLLTFVTKPIPPSFVRSVSVNKINGREYISAKLVQKHKQLQWVPGCLSSEITWTFNATTEPVLTIWENDSMTSSCNSHSKDKIVQNSNIVTGSNVFHILSWKPLIQISFAEID